ncbi:MAG: hypothetical protein ACFFDN_23870 [Candidatus Hodarchaeota archaeon]
MAQVMIWNPIERFLWGVTIMVLLITAIQYLRNSRKFNTINESLISFGVSASFFGMLLQVIFYFISDLVVPGNFHIDSNFYGDYGLVNINYEIIVKLGNLVGYVGVMIFYFSFERIIKKTRYILSIFMSFGMIILIIMPFEIMMNFSEILFATVVLTYLSIFVIYTRWSRLELKALTSFVFFGTVLIQYGIYLSVRIIKVLNVIPLIFAPIFYISGILLCLIPTVIDPNFFSRTIRLWLILGISTIIFNITWLVIFFVLRLSGTFLIIFIINTLATVFYVYLIIKSIKGEDSKKSREKQEEILLAFSRPKRITEEEVSISKEKKICLVCKGKLSRSLYLCPKCDAFYCDNCAQALSNLENVCWVCDEQIDQSKPIKLSKKDDEIMIEPDKKRLA